MTPIEALAAQLREAATALKIGAHSAKGRTACLKAAAFLDALSGPAMLASVADITAKHGIVTGDRLAQCAIDAIVTLIPADQPADGPKAA